uniref:arylesterase n=1 Tax=Sphingomonas bacterium TaxID=1895847 RepID=UPI00262D0A87|nr:arylesterase [Sphingomonas bacterium]
MLAFGDSLTAGYGLAISESFPAQLQTGLRVNWPNAVVRNAGVSGDTTASAHSRLPRLLSSLTALPDLAIVELGANDLLRGISPERTRANLDTILSEFGRRGIRVLLAAMELPSFLGTFSHACNAIYPELAAKHGVPSHPFFPRGVLGHRELVLRDRLHPNARAIELVTEAMLPAVIAALPRSAEAA